MSNLVVLEYNIAGGPVGAVVVVEGTLRHILVLDAHIGKAGLVS